MAKTIRVDALARVEGEGGLLIRYAGRRPKNVELRIFEPPRFFEAMLRGRTYLEPPDITSRICGICPVAYQMSACYAIEDALSAAVSPEIDALRRLLYAGEWIESHALHVFLLHAPDFLGFPDAVAMAKQHRDLVEAGLKIKKAGNAIVIAVGGREIHPINVRVGGFYSAPERRTLAALRPELEAALQLIDGCLERFMSFEFPAFERDYEFVALSRPDSYAVCGGRLVSSRGLDIAISEYPDHFVEEQVPHSTALHSRLRERDAYVCGPLARVNLGFDRLRPIARQAAARIGFSVPCKNPYKMLIARALEILHALDEAIALIDAYVPPDPPCAEIATRPGVGHGCTEAPRGLLYHRYKIDEQGLIEQATIIPPTSQNQRSIEADLFVLANELVDLGHEQATLSAERAIRNFDPCISCSTHFLKLTRLYDEQCAMPTRSGVSSVVVALGELLRGDDAVAIAVLDELRRRKLGVDVELARLAEPSELIERLRSSRRVILIDAVLADPPGRVRVLRDEDLDRTPSSALSTHGVGVGQALALSSELADGALLPELTIVAISIGVPHGLGEPLSDEVRAAIPRAADVVTDLVGIAQA